MNEDTVKALTNDSEIKERLTTTALTFLQQLSEENPDTKKVIFFATLAETAVIAGMVSDVATNMQVIEDKYIPKMTELCQIANTNDQIPTSSDAGAAYRDYWCVANLKNQIALYVKDQFIKSMHNLIQGKFSPIASHVLNRTVGTVVHNVMDKYVVRITVMTPLNR